MRYRQKQPCILSATVRQYGRLKFSRFRYQTVKCVVYKGRTFAGRQLVGPSSGVGTDQSFAANQRVSVLAMERARAAVHVCTRCTRTVAVQRRTRISTRYHCSEQTHTHDILTNLLGLNVAKKGKINTAEFTCLALILTDTLHGLYKCTKRRIYNSTSFQFN